MSYPPVVVVSDEPLAVGAEAAARYGGGGDYFPGTVAGMNRGGDGAWCYDIAFADGDHE